MKAIPRSKAKTAWGLLKDVRKAILDEPLRVNMKTVVAKRKPSEGGPACGTVGCLAGWTLLLAGKRFSYCHVRDWSLDVESLLGGRINIDFNTVVGRRYVFNSGDGDRCAWTIPGTPEHAEAVVARLDKFMEINKTALKKKKLPEKRKVATTAKV